MQIDKLSGEGELAYHKRLIYGKLLDKTLADVDYTELAERVYGQTYSSDHARKAMYGSCKTLQLLDRERESALDAHDIGRELDQKRAELARETKRFYDQRREYNKITIHESRFEHLTQMLVSAAHKLNDAVGLIFDGEMPECSLVDSPSGCEAVVVLCDWHYGMTADNMWNKYDTSICKERVKRTVERVTERLELHRPARLHVIILGDMLHGAIHTSARVASEELVCEQLMSVSEILAQAIAEMARHAPQTSVYATYGNHARTVQNKNDSIHHDNLERIIPWWLAQRLKDAKNIAIEERSKSEILFFDVCGYGFCASHGDLDNVKSAPRLFSAICQRVYGRDADCVILADKHHREEFEELGVTAIISSALCGADEYANNKRLYSTPGQTMIIVDKRQGVDAVYHLRCAA